MLQNRVLTYGIAGAVFFRAVMITLGAATLQVLRLMSVCTEVYNVSSSDLMGPQECVLDARLLSF